MAHILVVDDDPALNEMITEFIMLQGHTGETALDGDAALARLKKGSFDAMIIDRNMPPGLSGIEVITQIRAAPELAKLKILMLTSAGVTADIEEAFNAGADGYLLKPLDVAQFNGKLKALLES